MPVNSIRQKNGHKVYNKNATGMAGWYNQRGTAYSYDHYILRPKRPCHTDKIVRTVHNDGHDNPTRMRHAMTKAHHNGIEVPQCDS